MATSLQQSPIIGLLQIIGRVAQRYGGGNRSKVNQTDFISMGSFNR
jgi:hypothetical protein